MFDLIDIVSHDYEGERAATALHVASTALLNGDAWATLGGSVSREDFGNRLALLEHTIDNVVERATMGDAGLFLQTRVAVVDRLAAKFEAVHKQRAAEAQERNARRAARRAAEREIQKRAASYVPDDVVERLRQAIQVFDTEEWRDRYRRGDFPRSDGVQDLDKRFRWDLFWAAKGLDILDAAASGYDAGLKDAHIDTALRKIVAPLNATASRQGASNLGVDWFIPTDRKRRTNTTTAADSEMLAMLASDGSTAAQILDRFDTGQLIGLSTEARGVLERFVSTGLGDAPLNQYVARRKTASLFGNPSDHAAHPPASWVVVKVLDGLWHLKPSADAESPLESFTTKRDAEEAKVSGHLVNLYDQESRWYAGESIPNWKPYSQSLNEKYRTIERWDYGAPGIVGRRKTAAARSTTGQPLKIGDQLLGFPGSRVLDIFPNEALATEGPKAYRLKDGEPWVASMIVELQMEDGRVVQIPYATDDSKGVSAYDPDSVNWNRKASRKTADPDSWVTVGEWGVSYQNPAGSGEPYSRTRLNVHKLVDEPNEWGGMGTVEYHPANGMVFDTMEEARAYAASLGLIDRFDNTEIGKQYYRDRAQREIRSDYGTPGLVGRRTTAARALDWTPTGETWREFERAIRSEIDGLEWHTAETTGPFLPVSSISAVIKEFGIPAKAIAWNGYLDARGGHYGIYGIATNQQRLYVLDQGTHCNVICLESGGVGELAASASKTATAAPDVEVGKTYVFSNSMGSGEVTVSGVSSSARVVYVTGEVRWSDGSVSPDNGEPTLALSFTDNFTEKTASKTAGGASIRDYDHWGEDAPFVWAQENNDPYGPEDDAFDDWDDAWGDEPDEDDFDGLGFATRGESFSYESSHKTAKQPSEVVPGDIFVCDWGYDQTNIDFYQCTRVTAASIWLRKIAKQHVGTNGPSDKVVPVPNQFVGEEFRRKLTGGWRGEVWISINSFSGASLWNGQPESETNAMFGH